MDPVTHADISPAAPMLTHTLDALPAETHEAAAQEVAKDYLALSYRERERVHNFLLEAADRDKDDDHRREARFEALNFFEMFLDSAYRTGFVRDQKGARAQVLRDFDITEEEAHRLTNAYVTVASINAAAKARAYGWEGESGTG